MDVSGVLEKGKNPPAVVRRLIGMGTWLLRGMMAQEYEFLESEIEGLWRQLLEHGTIDSPNSTQIEHQIIDRHDNVKSTQIERHRSS